MRLWYLWPSSRLQWCLLSRIPSFCVIRAALQPLLVQSRLLVLAVLLLRSLAFASLHSDRVKMVATKVVNDTDSEIDVKEGNVGVYIPIQKLSKKGTKNSSCVIHVDTNATYREYRIAVLADNTGKRPIVVTSDDCIDNSILTIKFHDGQYVCDKTARGQASGKSAVGTNKLKGWKERLLKLFFLRRALH